MTKADVPAKFLFRIGIYGVPCKPKIALLPCGFHGLLILK